MWKAIAKNISETIQRPFEIEQKRSVSGGVLIRAMLLQATD